MRLTVNRISQPLLFAPSELIACGLRDAHTKPLVGKRTESGVRSWRTSPARAWAWPLVEWSRTGNSYAAIGFDCDSREAVELAAASCMGAGDLPTPNVYAARTASGHAQVFYLLDRPVHRGEHARAKPLTYLARVSEFYRATLGADPGYCGVLSSNPVHADYQASYPRADPYALGDLASWIPKGWRVPRVRRPRQRGATWSCSGRCASWPWAAPGHRGPVDLWRGQLQSLIFHRPPGRDAEVRDILAVCVPLPGTLARPRAYTRLALETGRTGAQGRRWAQGWHPVWCVGQGHALEHDPRTVGRRLA